MKNKIYENSCYVVLTGLIIGQCVIGKWYLLGQSFYLVCNLIQVARDFILNRPKADKVKDIVCTVITIGLIVIWVL